jgi:hypothetical protein
VPLEVSKGSLILLTDCCASQLRKQIARIEACYTLHLYIRCEYPEDNVADAKRKDAKSKRKTQVSLIAGS